MPNNQNIKSLAKDTAIYGVSSIVGKFFNWLLVPLYSYTILESDYGIVALLYSWVALIIIVLTYGMETGYFRYAAAQPNEKEANRVYTTTLSSIGITSLIFIALVIIFNAPMAKIITLGGYEDLVLLMGITVAIDAFSSIPFSYLRYKQRPVMFMTIKTLMIFCNIFLNIFFLLICPKINESSPDLISWFYNPDYKIKYIVIANFLSSIAGIIALLPFMMLKWRFSFSLLKKMLKYSLPLLLFGIAGIMNQTIDKLIFPYFYSGTAIEAKAQLGIYYACFKIAMVMMMFTYAFRFAYEPFVFAKKNAADSKSTYSTAMTFFVISSMLIFLFIVAYLDVLKLLLKENFRVGISIIPFILITYFFQGVFYNLSLWYKLTDKTMWGTWLSLVGLAIIFVLDALFIPRFSYWACVFASLFSFFAIMIISYFLGQKYYPIKYDLKKIGKYFALAVVLSLLMLLVKMPNFWLTIVWRTALLTPFVIYVFKNDIPIKEIPFFKKFRFNG